jgi:hypothetical protein
MEKKQQTTSPNKPNQAKRQKYKLTGGQLVVDLFLKKSAHRGRNLGALHRGDAAGRRFRGKTHCALFSATGDLRGCAVWSVSKKKKEKCGCRSFTREKKASWSYHCAPPFAASPLQKSDVAALVHRYQGLLVDRASGTKEAFTHVQKKETFATLQHLFHY